MLCPLRVYPTVDDCYLLICMALPAEEQRLDIPHLMPEPLKLAFQLQENLSYYRIELCAVSTFDNLTTPVA